MVCGFVLVVFHLIGRYSMVACMHASEKVRKTNAHVRLIGEYDASSNGWLVGWDGNDVPIRSGNAFDMLRRAQSSA